jgi:hypothetical protein
MRRGSVAITVSHILDWPLAMITTAFRHMERTSGRDHAGRSAGQAADHDRDRSSVGEAV